MTARLARAVGGCVVLGIGVGLLLRAELGSDGYSTLVDGLHLSLEVPYAVVGWVTGVLLLLLAWTRGEVPGIGTLANVFIVGLAINVVLDTLDPPDPLGERIALMVGAVVLMAVGIAVYLSGELGAGPVEAAARAFDPPVPFAWSYGVVQAGGALGGWQLGAPIGPATVLIILGLGPLVALLLRLSPPPAPPDPRPSP